MESDIVVLCFEDEKEEGYNADTGRGIKCDSRESRKKGLKRQQSTFNPRVVRRSKDVPETGPPRYATAARTSTRQPNLVSQRFVIPCSSLAPAPPPNPVIPPPGLWPKVGSPPAWYECGFALVTFGVWFAYVAGVEAGAWSHAEARVATFAGVDCGGNADGSSGGGVYGANDVANFESILFPSSDYFRVMPRSGGKRQVQAD